MYPARPRLYIRGEYTTQSKPDGPAQERAMSRTDNAEPADITAAKRTLRLAVLARRDELAGAERRAGGAAIRARLTALPQVTVARTVFAFASFRTEVDTIPFLQWCLDRGVTVGTPRIEGPHHMEAYALTDLERDFVTGRHLIPEPRDGLAQIDPALIDVVILPGSAFDEHGGRLGYGGGFYDTFLGRLRPGTPRIGLCFEAQLVDDVPRASHDLCVDLLVTEERLIETGCR